MDPWKDTVSSGKSYSDAVKGAAAAPSTIAEEGKNIGKCRICSNDHWTSKCPWKDTVLSGGKIPDADKKAAAAPSTSAETGKPASIKYVPPIQRGHGNAQRMKLSGARGKDDTSTIRILNWSDSTTKSDSEDLIKPASTKYLPLISIRGDGNTKRKEEDDKMDEYILKALVGKNKYKCRVLSREYWSCKCPWKNTVLFGDRIPDTDKTAATAPSTSTEASKGLGDKNKNADKRVSSTKANKGLRDKKFNKCGICSGEHWASKCHCLSGGKIPDADKRVAAVPSTSANACKPAHKGYLPPNMLGDGNAKRMEYSMPGARGRDDTTAIRISNLSDSTTESHLEDLVKPFGPIQKLYLARDKQQAVCKGFAYVHFKFCNDAAKAIATLNGYGYDHLILSVDWSKPSAPLTSTEASKVLGGQNIVKCRTCSGEHWASKCPCLSGGKIPDADKRVAAVPSTSANACKPAHKGYLPPNMLGDGNAKRMEYSMPGVRGRENFAIRISNLSDSTTESHLEDLVKPFGPIQKLYLARDKQQAVCKGFAYVHFKFRNDAAKAIATLNGYGYDYLILSVDWSKPSAPLTSTEASKVLGGKNIVKCRTCSGEHWTSKCLWKDTVLSGGRIPDADRTAAAAPSAFAEACKPVGTKYLPSSLQGDSKSKRMVYSIPGASEINDTAGIRIANLSDSTTESDLEDLLKPFGPIQKLYLGKIKKQGICKGFACVHFKFRNDAAKAVATLNGYGYDHLILTVDWSKPPAH